MSSVYLKPQDWLNRLLGGGEGTQRRGELRGLSARPPVSEDRALGGSGREDWRDENVNQESGVLKAKR